MGLFALQRAHAERNWRDEALRVLHDLDEREDGTEVLREMLQARLHPAHQPIPCRHCSHRAPECEKCPHGGSDMRLPP